MSQAVAMMTNRFDLAALDALLGPKGFISALSRDDATGCVRYAALNRDSFDDGALVRVTASYALGFPGRGRRIYTLLALDLQVQDGVATVLCARRMGRLAPPAPLAEALMTLARSLAGASLPGRAQLAPFLPLALLDTLENIPSAADFPDEGIDREERLPEALWDRPSILRGDRIDPGALTVTLNLAVGERAQLTDIDPATGDYRVFHLGIAATPEGGATLVFELYRQGPGVERRIFSVLSLAIGAPGADGFCPVKAFTCDAGANPDGFGLADLPRLLPVLARIAASLQEKQRPEDALVRPLLSKPALALWTQSLAEGGGS